MAFLQGRLVDNLPKIYGIYTGGFIVFILLMAILSKLGVSPATIGILFVAFTICIYAIIGWLSRTMQLDAYYVAGREVPAVYNGMATAADWMSGASFVALAGGVYFGGYIYMGFVVGWTGGYVLVNALMAPYLRKFGCYTVPDFIGTRYGGNLARLCAVVVLVVASFTYVTAQINASGTIAARALQIPFSVGIWVGLGAILLCSMLGGMRAVTWTQVAQYIVLIIAYLTPVIWMSNVQGFGIIPHFGYGDAVHRIQELQPTIGLGAKAAESFQGLRILSTPINATGAPLESWKFFTLALCMMTGTASLPHILMRYFTTPTVRAARKSVGWSLFFIFLLYFTAPCLATLTKLQIIDPNLPTAIIGKPFAEVANLAWIKNWAAVGMLKISDGNHDGILQLNEFFMRPDIVVLATPEMAGLPYVISGLVAAGGLAAAMSTADGLLLAIANALSHDLYYKMIDPNADTRLRLIVARVLLVIIGAAGVRDRIAPAHRHSRRGGLGVLLRQLRPLLPARARRVVEAGQPRRSDRGHGLRLPRRRRLPLVRPDRRRAVARHRRPALRHDRHAGQPGRHGGGQPDDAGAGRGNAEDDRRGSYPHRRHDPRRDPLIV